VDPEPSVVTTQPKLRPEMRSIWQKRPKAPKPTSQRPIEMTRTEDVNVLIEINDVTATARHRGGYEKTRAWPPRKKSHEQKNEATVVESAQKNCPQSEYSQIKAKAAVESTIMATTKKAHPKPEQSRNKGKAQTEAKSKSMQMINEVESRIRQENYLVDCTKIENIQKQKLASYELTNCNTVMESSMVVQRHTLADCDNSAASENQELSYVHDFTDCPVDKAILEYYEKQERSVQSHGLADCARGSSAGNKRSGSWLQQHNLADCATGSTDSPNESTAVKAHNLADCSRRSSSNAPLSNNPYLEHSLADCPGNGSPSSTVRSDKQYRSASGIVDSTSKSMTHAVVQHRLSSCPTPIAPSGNRSSDDSQATQAPASLSTNVAHHNTDTSGGSGTSESQQKDAEGQFYNRQRRRHKGKRKANENATKVNGGESSHPAEHSAQHSLQQLLVTADGIKQDEGKSAEILKANLYMDPEGTVQSTLY
jgi:hypothetical protein